MTNTLLEILTGSLLGDGYLACYGRAKNAMYKLKQSANHASYVGYMYKALGEYVSCGVHNAKSRKPSKVHGKISHSLDDWSGEYCWNAYFWTKAHPCFTVLYNEWYKDNIKVIPANLVLTPVSLSHWFVEDGSNNVTYKSKCVFLHTHAFSEAEVDFLIHRLEADLCLQSKRYTGPVIRIKSGSYFDFMDIVRDHVLRFGCFDYKVDISKAPADRKGESWDGPKLTLERAREIRTIRSQKQLKLKDIAAMYQVSVATIGKIVNNQLYKEPLKVCGSADVRLGLKYGNQR